MSWLDFISPGITAASQVAGGYARGQERAETDRRTQALLAIKQKRQDEQDAIMNALRVAQTRSANATADQGPGVTYQPDAEGNIIQLPTHAGPTKPVSPVPATPSPEAAPIGPAASPSPSEAPSVSSPAPVSAPVTPSPAIGVKTGLKGPPKAPVPGSPEWKAEKVAEAKIGAQYGYHPPRNIDPLSPEGIAAQAKVAAGKKGGTTNLPAPMAAKVAQFGEMLKKASDLMPATDALNVSLGNSASQDVATHGVGAFGVHIPGAQGLGSMMVNRSPEYATYQAALSPFILAAAHALSGARINDTQVQQIRASIEIKPGDSPQVRVQKHKNVIDLINSIGGSLPSDAISAQEDQMEPNAMTMLTGYGYRAAKRGTASTGGSSGDINLSGGKPKLTQAEYDAGLANNTDAVIAQHYDLSAVKRKKAK